MTTIVGSSNNTGVDNNVIKIQINGGEGGQNNANIVQTIHKNIQNTKRKINSVHCGINCPSPHFSGNLPIY